MKIIHTHPNVATDDPRVLRAQDTWKVLYEDYGWVPVLPEEDFECRVEGDPRTLFVMKHLLDWAKFRSSSQEDILVITCDDVILRPCIDQQVREIAARCRLFTAHSINCESFDQVMQPHEPRHINEGRAMIGCLAGEWWKIRDYIPQFYTGTGQTDLYVAALARKLAGSRWSPQTSRIIDPACELEPGCIWHEQHPKSWNENMPGDKRDWELVARAFKQFMPEIMPEYMKHQQP